MKKALFRILFFVFVWEGLALFLGGFRFPELFDFVGFLAGSFAHDPIIAREGGGALGFLPHIAASAGLFVAALGCGILLGVGLAGALFKSGLVGQSFYWIIRFLGVLPPLIFIPFLLLAVGPNAWAVFASGLIFASYSTCLYATESMSAVSAQYADSARILGASKGQIAHSIYFPAMIPGLVGGVRSTAALTLGIVILAEYLGSPMGLGRVIKYAISYSNALLIFTAIFWAVVVGILADRVLIFGFKAKWLLLGLLENGL